MLTNSNLHGRFAANFSSKLGRLFTLLLIAAIFVAAGVLVVANYEKALHEDRELLVKDLARRQANAIEVQIYASIAATQALKMAVIHAGGDLPDFDLYAADILRNFDGVANLQLAENGIVSRIYPLAGNERAIGHNVLKADDRRAEALAAVKDKALTLAGPFKLIQGGMGVVARNPVFLPGKEGEEFWGFTSALFHLEELIGKTALESVANERYRLTISHSNPYENREVRFYDNGIVGQGLTAYETIQLPNTQWWLELQEARAPFDYAAYQMRLLLAVLILLLLLVVRSQLRHPALLAQKVKEQTAMLSDLAHKDMVTGVANRRWFYQYLIELLSRSHSGNSGALYLIDVDDFKSINDTKGHHYGDLFLKALADRMQQHVTDGGILARIGGDEFALVELGVDSAQLGKRAQTLVELISEPITVDDGLQRSTASVGVVRFPDDGSDLNKLFSRADLAMYEAKRLGKNNYQVFVPALEEDMRSRTETIEDLRKAIIEGQLFVHWQPIVDARNSSIQMFEVLVRWRHPDRGMVPPDQFISLAEQAGLIDQIGYYVLELSLQHLKWWESERNIKVRLAINLSVKQFQDRDLVCSITSLLSKYDVAPDRIEVEVTETALMLEPQQTVEALKKLRGLGIKVALDDFGTGYSSFSMLRTLPVDYLKIDRSFIKRLPDKSKDGSIVNSIVGMAHTLDIKVVAEGVETLEQLSALREYRCDFVQGYLLARPGLPQDFDASLALARQSPAP